MNEYTMPPADTDAEEAVLGSIFIDPETALPAVLGEVEARDFYRERNGWVFDACCAVYMRGDGLNLLTVAHELQQAGRLEAVGGIAYLSTTAAQVPTSVHAAEYARLVRQAAFSRRLISAAGRIAAIGYANAEPDAALGRAQQELLALGSLVGGTGLRSLREVATAHRAEMEAWVQDPASVAGVSTGITELDASIGGFERSKMYVLAARTSMGKSSVALAFATRVARQGRAVAVFSPEMSELAVLFRLVLTGARVDRYAARQGRARPGWQEDFWRAYEQVAGLPIWLDDTSALTTQTARVRVAQLRALRPDLGLVVYDYANLAGDDPGADETHRVSSISRRLQALGKTLDVAVLAVYQLNRGPEDPRRHDHRPQLSDLRQSGVIEECADVVMMLYRPEYYYDRAEDCPPGEKSLLELYIRKQRDGRTGKVSLYFDPRTGVVGPWEKLRAVE